VTRRVSTLVAAAVAVAAFGSFALYRDGSKEGSVRPSPVPPVRRSVMLIVQADPRPMIALVGEGGNAPPAAMVVPAATIITIPGQGDGTAADAADLPGIEGSTALSNLLGAWIEHAAAMDPPSLAALVDRVGGLQLSKGPMTGDQVVTYLAGGSGASQLRWQEVLNALLGAGAWQAGDFTASDDPAAAAAVLAAAKGAGVEELPTTQASSDLLAPDFAAIASVAPSFGGTTTQPVPVIVLNGSGRPGVGESIAAKLVPGGYRVVVSGNASTFDHATTLIVAGTEADRATAAKAAQLLGVGEVSVSGLPSGLAGVTIVVGKDYRE
jgi:hypothetical protein